jgi:putative exporter of polyketide antibiotics
VIAQRVLDGALGAMTTSIGLVSWGDVGHIASSVTLGVTIAVTTQVVIALARYFARHWERRRLHRPPHHRRRTFSGDHRDN